MADHPEGRLAEILLESGVDPRHVDVEWDELCREDVLTFAGNSYPDATLVRLAELYLTFPSRFVFATDALQRTFERVVMNSPTILRDREEAERNERQTLEDHGLSAFAAYDPNRETLKAFALRVEAACGFAAGEMLSVHGNDHISIRAARPDKLTMSDFEVLLPLLGRSAPGIGIGVVSQDTG